MNVVARTIRHSIALALIPSPLSAQSISFGLRGTVSFATGDFAADPSSTNTALMQGAKQGFGYVARSAVTYLTVDLGLALHLPFGM